MNNENNNLNNSQKQTMDSAPAIIVVDNTSDVSNIEATISTDNRGNVDPISLEYNEYRNDLNKIYSTTTDENSLVSKFVVENGKCIHTLVVKYSNGTVSTEKSHIFDYTDNFKNGFLFPMLEDYNKYNAIFDDNCERIVNTAMKSFDSFQFRNKIDYERIKSILKNKYHLKKRFN